MIIIIFIVFDYNILAKNCKESGFSRLCNFKVKQFVNILEPWKRNSLTTESTPTFHSTSSEEGDQFT